MIFFLIGCISGWALILAILFIERLLNTREKNVRAKILQENLEYLAKHSKELDNQRHQLLASILQNPEARKLYNTIDVVIERLVKRQGVNIEIPSGVCIEMSCETLHSLVLSLKEHIADNKKLQESLDQFN